MGELSDALGVGIGEILKGEIDITLRDNDAMIKDVVINTNKETKNKLFINISKILTIIIIFICIYLIFMSIRQVIFLNTYTTSSLNLKEDIDKNYNSIKDKIKIINNLDKFIDKEKNEFNYKIDLLLKAVIENNILYNYQPNEKFYYANYYDTYLKLEVLSNYPLALLGTFINYTDYKPIYELISYNTGFVYTNNDYYENVSYNNNNYDSSIYDYSNIKDQEIDLDSALNKFNNQLKNINSTLDLIIEIGENNE